MSSILRYTLCLQLQTLLKYHETQINAAHCEFYNIYELIQQYLSSDHDLQMQNKSNNQEHNLKNKRK